MTTTAVLRLLTQGIPGFRPGADNAAGTFTPDELAASPLAPPSPLPVPENRPSVPETDSTEGGGGKNADKKTGPTSAPGDWTETRPDGEVPMLERFWPGLPAPLYLAGPATSSLDVAHALARRGLLPEWSSVLVLSQSAGRGQLRRAWASPGGNLYAALRLPRDGPLNTGAAAPAVGGLLVAALTELGYAVSLKWPNDILQATHEEYEKPHGAQRPCSPTSWAKVGGILLEERGGVLLAGIGINIISAPPPSGLRDNFAFKAGVLRRPPAAERPAGTAPAPEGGGFTPLLPLWTRLAGLVFSCYFQKNIEAESPWWPALAQQHLAFRGCRVRLEDALPEHDRGTGRSFCEGVVEGLCVSGALRLRVKSETRTFLGGSLVPQE